VDGARREHRAAHGDDALDQVGPARCEAAGEHAAEAVADDADLAVALDRDRLEPALQTVGGLASAADVDVDLGTVGAEPRTAQEAGHRLERRVAGHEPGDQQHGVVRRHPVAACVGQR
jgi:hypothetical protein